MADDAAWLTAETQALATMMLDSHQRAFGRPLIATARPGRSRRLQCQELFACGFPVLAHGTGLPVAVVNFWGLPPSRAPGRRTSEFDRRAERRGHGARQVKLHCCKS